MNTSISDLLESAGEVAELEHPIVALAPPVKGAPESVKVGHLLALQSQKHIYGGTVPQAVVGRHRAANKVARKSRRVNRRGR